jgi:hypothetical protein
MAKTIPQLTDATTVNAADELIVQQGGITKRATGAELAKGLNTINGTVNVKDFGAVGDGVADDAPAFAAAHAAAPVGACIHVPSGTYLFSTSVTATGRQFLFAGATTTGSDLVGALIQRIDPVTGAWSFGVGEPLQYGSTYRFGRNSAGPIGLQIGGGDPKDGVSGNVLFSDAYAGWTTVMPSIFPSTTEFAIQPTAVAGECTLAIGGNTVTKTSGADFFAKLVGKRMYIGQGRYLCASVVNATTATVTNLDGSAVSFGAAGPETFVFAPTLGEGTCNTSGTTVTRIAGDPFVVMSNTEYKININGTVYDVSSTSGAPNSLTLGSSAGTQTNVSYEFWTSVDDIMSAFRVHRISGAGFEENITIGAYGSGYFHIQSAGGVGRQYPLYIGTGYDVLNGKRKQIALQADGDVNIGGEGLAAVLTTESLDGNACNGFIMSAGASGQSASLTTAGTDTNIAFRMSTKGSGIYRFNSHSYSAVQFEIDQLSTGTSWLGVRSDAFDQPRLYAAGAAANIDIALIPKGTGRVLLGAHTDSADAAVNGFITVKDSAGVERKLATIA